MFIIDHFMCMMDIFHLTCSISMGIVLFFILVCCYFRIYKWIQSKWSSGVKNLAFFHPYCNSGGGGERVLWKMIEALLNSKEHRGYKIIVYSGDLDQTLDDILFDVEKKFSIKLMENKRERVSIVHILSRTLLEARWYPVATMIGQSLGSIIVGIECIMRYVPDVFCDTTGAAFMFPIISTLIGCEIMTYVHYPTISMDMLQEVIERRPSYNNKGHIVSNSNISRIKQIYYIQFTKLYTFAGQYPSTVMVNGTWTYEHIQSLWKFPSSNLNDGGNNKRKRERKLVKIFPPCSTSHLQSIPIDINTRQRIIISIGQFRPEKDHMLQLRSFYELNQLDKDGKYRDVKLVMLGSTRNREDEHIVSNLRQEISNLKLESMISIVLNASYSDLITWLSNASFGIHTMWNEHFGISVVEMMAAGLIVIAHNSAGPKMDIVTPLEGFRTGYLASTPQEYAICIKEALELSDDESLQMRIRARKSMNRFSDEIFSEAIVHIISPFP